MNAPELTEDENLGLYQRATENGPEWWRVSVADRPENYRLEHGVGDGHGAGAVDMDLVVDAENLRARLALAGWEATVQEGALPDKSVRYRVRLGPYDNADELGRMKGELAKRGFDVAVIRY